MTDMLIRNTRISAWGSEPCDVAITDGLFAGMLMKPWSQRSETAM